MIRTYPSLFILPPYACAQNRNMRTRAGAFLWYPPAHIFVCARNILRPHVVERSTDMAVRHSAYAGANHFAPVRARGPICTVDGCTRINILRTFSYLFCPRTGDARKYISRPRINNFAPAHGGTMYICGVGITVDVRVKTLRKMLFYAPKIVPSTFNHYFRFRLHFQYIMYIICCIMPRKLSGFDANIHLSSTFLASNNPFCPPLPPSVLLVKENRR